MNLESDQVKKRVRNGHNETINSQSIKDICMSFLLLLQAMSLFNDLCLTYGIIPLKPGPFFPLNPSLVFYSFLGGDESTMSKKGLGTRLWLCCP